MRGLFILSLFIAFAAPAASSRGDMLTFRNGDKMTGAMIGYDAKEGFLWEHPAIAGRDVLDGVGRETARVTEQPNVLSLVARSQR